MSIAGEKATVERMIRIYCRLEHGRGGPCPECADLIEYARARLDRCRHGDEKPPCRACGSHCYELGRRSAIRAAMRKAGPWMLLVDPIRAIRHLMTR